MRKAAEARAVPPVVAEQPLKDPLEAEAPTRLEEEPAARWPPAPAAPWAHPELRPTP